MTFSKVQNTHYGEKTRVQNHEKQLVPDRVLPRFNILLFPYRFGENWYLRESPQYNHQGSGGSGSGGSNNGRRRVFNSLEGYELEISQDSGRQTVSRLHRMLQETDDRLERLQSEVHQVSRGEKEPSEEGVANR